MKLNDASKFNIAVKRTSKKSRAQIEAEKAIDNIGGMLVASRRKYFINFADYPDDDEVSIVKPKNLDLKFTNEFIAKCEENLLNYLSIELCAKIEICLNELDKMANLLPYSEGWILDEDRDLHDFAARLLAVHNCSKAEVDELYSKFSKVLGSWHSNGLESEKWYFEKDEDEYLYYDLLEKCRDELETNENYLFFKASENWLQIVERDLLKLLFSKEISNHLKFSILRIGSYSFDAGKIINQIFNPIQDKNNKYLEEAFKSEIEKQIFSPKRANKASRESAKLKAIERNKKVRDFLTSLEKGIGFEWAHYKAKEFVRIHKLGKLGATTFRPIFNEWQCEGLNRPEYLGGCMV